MADLLDRIDLGAGIAVTVVCADNELLLTCPAHDVRQVFINLSGHPEALVAHGGELIGRLMSPEASTPKRLLHTVWNPLGAGLDESRSQLRKPLGDAIDHECVESRQHRSLTGIGSVADKRHGVAEGHVAHGYAA